MSIFQPPPPQFVGGAQPYAPPRPLTPPSVDRPPFSHNGRAVVAMAVVASVWAMAADQAAAYQFIGGKQPFAPRYLAGKLLDNPPQNPPFGSQGRNNWVPSVLAAWQPDSDQPSYRFAGGKQPFAPRQLAANLLNNPPQNPPFVPEGRSNWLPSILVAWQPPDPLPTLRGTLNPSLLNVTPDNPPFGLLETIVDPWLGDPPLPTLPRNTPQGAVAVVQGAYTPPWLSAVLAAWQPADVAPQTATRLTPPSVDNPPFRHVGRAGYLANVAAAWQPPDPPPTLAAKLTPPSVDNPPRFRAFTPYPVTPDPQPTLAGKLTPPSVDVPPPLTRAQQSVTQESVPLPQQTKYLPQGVIAVASGTPYAPVWLTAVLSWQPTDPPPTLSVKLNPALLNVTPDNPPFGLLETIYEPFLAAGPLPTVPRYLVQPGAAVVAQIPYARPWLVSVLASWQQSTDPLPTLPIRSAGIPGWSVDNPPGLPATDMLALDAPYPLPQRTVYLPQGTAVPVNNPPFSYAGRNAYLVTVIAAWQPPDPPPTLPRYLVQPGAAPSADNPPFGLLETIIEPWLGDGPLPTVPRYLVQPGAAVTAQTPFVGSWLPIVLSAWQVTDPPPVLPRHVTPPSVDNPPFTGRSDRPGILAQWTAPLDPLPTLPRWLVQGTPVPVNNPPFTHPGRSERDNILSQWQPPVWQYDTIRLTAKLAQEGPSPPPPPLERFTVSGPDVRDLFGPVGDVTANWSGGVQKRTV